jgi:two-component system chemotaxis response regulator CheB
MLPASILLQPAPLPTAQPALAASVSPAARRIRVLVVDDSVVIRRFLSRILTDAPGFEVVGFAANGVAAVRQAFELQPDAITMDIEMPEMDGVATVRELRRMASKAVIIMCSTLTSRGASSTIEALLAGANDYVTKPASSDSMDAAFEALRQELIPKIKQFFVGREFLPPAVLSRNVSASATTVATAALCDTPAQRLSSTALAREQRRIVAIGVSTGGPTALMKLLPALPRDFPLPIVIVQHMPPVFTRQMADRLGTESQLEVLEAAEGMALKAGRVMIAPGDYHMRLERAGHETVVRLDQKERENSCRPAVDVLFRSVAALYGGQVLGIMLTGMGQDGLRGTEVLKQKGAYIMVQDRATSVVWSMPGAVAEAGLANAIVPLDEMAPAILRQVPSR